MKKFIALIMALVLLVSCVPVTADAASVKLNKSKVTLEVGQQTTLKVKNTKKKVKWTSSKKSVATVSAKGKVTAKKAGITTITATVSKKKLKCVVTVKESEDIAFADENRQIELELINAEREKAGVREIELDEMLTTCANERAKEIAELFSHTRPDGTTCFSILDTYNVSYFTAGENIASGQRDAKNVVNSWMNSPGHRENILRPEFGKIGIGIYKKGSTVCWVQMFTN